MTVTAIVLAAGVTIGAVVSAISNSLKAMGKGMANGLKALGQKESSMLSGPSIFAFLFKTADQAIEFLAEHTWLLILAAVAFLMEQHIKKSR